MIFFKNKKPQLFGLWFVILTFEKLEGFEELKFISSVKF
jgi:hypothetical protein